MGKSKFNAPQPRRQFSEGQKSKGILDDYATRGDVATKEGTIEHTPTAAKHITNKEYVDLAIDTDITTHVGTAQAHSDYLLNTGDTSTGDISIVKNNPTLNLGDSLGGGNFGFIRWVSATDSINLGTTVGGTWNDQITLLESGNVGIGTTSPAGKLHINGNGADIFLEDDSSNKVWKLRNSGGGKFAIQEDATGPFRFTILNGGNVGVNISTPTIQLDVNAKSGHTSIGGFVIKLTNKTGGNTVAGQLVAPYSATAVDDAFKTALANSDEVIGIVLEAGVADGSEAWVVVSGIADVLTDGGGAARGDRMIASATAGSADVWNVGGAVATHFLEIGHSLETVSGGALARCVLHFN